MNKNEKELDRLRKFDSNLELNISNGRRNVIGGMFSTGSKPSMKSDINISLINEKNNENIMLKERENSINSSTRTNVKPIGLLNALSKINSNIF